MFIFSLVKETTVWVRTPISELFGLGVNNQSCVTAATMPFDPPFRAEPAKATATMSRFIEASKPFQPIHDGAGDHSPFSIMPRVVKFMPLVAVTVFSVLMISTEILP
jgi:hypothetical protein